MSIQDLDTPRGDTASVPMAPTDGQIKAPVAPAYTMHGASSQDNSSASPSKAPKLCGVCNKEPPRYKCPRCLLPYCSLTCSNLHKQSHASDPPPPPKEPSPSLPLTPAAPLHPGRAGTISGSHARTGGPFAGLETLPELHALFARYPSLPSQLDAILRETLPPDSTNGPTRREPAHGRRGFAQKNNDKQGLPWTHDRGLDRGVKALGLARARCGVEGEGVREFGELVLRVVERGAENMGGGNERSNGNGDEWGGVWREEVEESVKAVERLLKVEDKGMR